MTAQELIDGKYYQTSRGHRMLARLPQGKTGKQALYDYAKESGYVIDPDTWVQSMDEYSAGDYYLRVGAPEADRVTIDRDTFEEYRRLGGGTYATKDSDRRLREEMETRAGHLSLTFVRALAASGCNVVAETNGPVKPCLERGSSLPCLACQARELLIKTGLLPPIAAQECPF